MKRLKVLISDDHPLILAGLQRLLEQRFDVVGAVANGMELIRAALRLVPDLIILDITMPILNGMDAAQEIRKSLRQTKFIFLSMHTSKIYLHKAIEAGASAYVLKSSVSEDLLKAIEIVQSGKPYFSPALGKELIEEISTSWQGTSHSSSDLTGRQRQILQLITEGRLNKEIAGLLCVSVRTVEFHRGRLMARLGVHGSAALCRFAIQEGLVSPSN